MVCGGVSICGRYRVSMHVSTATPVCVLLMVFAAARGFLYHNLNPEIFMGDAGSAA
jgi:UDP-N-acetylmuramyl pentapeptide phosphotransferase/UDP-N-acetylglucosamine-1-phosphate transferase